MRNWSVCARTIRGRSSGRSSRPPASARAATCASATWTATGVPDMLIAQNIRRVQDDAFDAISCLTAVNLDGKVLWQTGRPDPRNGLLTNDTPFQIHDIDGDGQNEVVLVRDFKLQILDGTTGKVKRWAVDAQGAGRQGRGPTRWPTAIPSSS